jgi:hypothetical protein
MTLDNPHQVVADVRFGVFWRVLACFGVAHRVLGLQNSALAEADACNRRAQAQFKFML